MSVTGITSPDDKLHGIVADKETFTFFGVPPNVFMNGAPSEFRDSQIKAYVVERDEQPPEGGYLVYYVNQKYPRKGVLIPPAIIACGSVKRPLIINTFKLAAKLWFLLLPVLCIPFLRKWVLWKVGKWYVDGVELILAPFYVWPQKCCTSVREYFRVAHELFKDKRFSQEKGKIIDRIFFSIGMFLEYDDSYRYRWQDIFGNWNKKQSVEKNVKRLYALFIKRDKNPFSPKGSTSSMDFRFKEMFLALRVILFLFPSWKKMIQNGVQMMDFKKIKLDEADFYHCMPRCDFMFRGETFAKRMKKREAIDKESWERSVDKVALQHDQKNQLAGGTGNS